MGSPDIPILDVGGPNGDTDLKKTRGKSHVGYPCRAGIGNSGSRQKRQPQVQRLAGRRQAGVRNLGLIKVMQDNLKSV
jgi:hypothetical protein